MGVPPIDSAKKADCKEKDNMYMGKNEIIDVVNGAKAGEKQLAQGITEEKSMTLPMSVVIAAAADQTGLKFGVNALLQDYEFGGHGVTLKVAVGNFAAVKAPKKAE